MAILHATLAKEVDGVIQYIYPRSTSELIVYNDNTTVKDKLDSLEDRLNGLKIDDKLAGYYTKEEVSDMVYAPIHVYGVSVSPDICESGSMQSVAVYWECSRTPAALNIDGIAVNPASQSGSKVFTNITSDRTFTVSATDSGSASNDPYTCTMSATVRFYPGIYFGAANMPTEYNSSFILTLPTKRLQPTPEGSFTVNAGTNQHIFFACPASFTPRFNVSGFVGGFSVASTLTFVNAYGSSMGYTIYRSDNAGLGNTTVTVYA